MVGHARLFLFILALFPPLLYISPSSTLPEAHPLLRPTTCYPLLFLGAYPLWLLPCVFPLVSCALGLLPCVSTLVSYPLCLAPCGLSLLSEPLCLIPSDLALVALPCCLSTCVLPLGVCSLCLSHCVLSLLALAL